MFSQTRKYNESGDYDRAMGSSSQAKIFNIAAIILGLVLDIPLFIIIIVGNIVAAAN